MERLKRRTDFRAAAQGARAPAKAFVLQARRRSDEGAARLGFTVSRQVGNAVKRNRVRRRLREIVRLADAGQLCAGHDYVLIGRPTALQLPFADMTRDFANALRRVHTAPAKPAPAKAAPANTAPAGAGSERSLHRAGSPSRPRRQPEQRGTPQRQDPKQDPKQEPKDEP